ncbi:CoA-binding protein [Ascidiimonas sp. W6]|uniref:CoA-binding protein n=1 Tax=Ascidiimonas meishanensis TaxID=3128903 RepID=UPI0030ED8D5F
MAKTLVMGASLSTNRYSNMAIRNLRKKNQEVVAFGMREGEVLDVTVVNTLIQYTDVETVTLYLNPVRQESYYQYIISLKPKRVIFNPGTENMEFYKLLEVNNIKVEEACTLVMLSTNQY